MKNNESENSTIEENSSEANVCDLKDLIEMMNGKRHLIKEIMNTFLEETPKELLSINDAVSKIDYAGIKKISHSMRSTVSIMGISILDPILKEMEDLGTMATDLEKIKILNQKLNTVCQQAIVEIEQEALSYN